MVVVDDMIEIESGSEPLMIDVLGNDYIMSSGDSEPSGDSKLWWWFQASPSTTDQSTLSIKSVTEDSPDSPVSCEAMGNEVMVKVTDETYVGGADCFYTVVMRDSLGNEETVDQQGTINISVTPGCEPIYEILSSDSFSILYDAVLAAGLDKVLANPNLDPKLTLFAPPEMDERLLESAWLPQLLDNLLYYMLEGRKLSVDLGFIQGFVPSVNFQREQVLILAEPPTIDGVELDPTDTLACNGVIHEVFDELQPASSDSGNDIVEMLSRNQECKTLVDLIGPAGLVSDLQGEGPFTVFAPTDAAFLDLNQDYPGILDYLTEPANIANLTYILQYNIASANALSPPLDEGSLLNQLLEDSPTLKDGSTLTTLTGDEVVVGINSPGTLPARNRNLESRSILINDSLVIIANIIAYNGIVHVIDKVLLPPDFVPPVTTTTTTTTTSTVTVTTTNAACQDRGFYFVTNADGSDGLCTNAVDSSNNGCNATQTGSGSGPCTMQSCCSIYQHSGDCHIFDNCNVVPTIVYVNDFPLFQPTGDVDKPAHFLYDVLAGDFIEDRKLGDFLVVDKVEGAFEFPLPPPVYDEFGNCVNCVNAGTCIAAKKHYNDKYNTMIKYTAPSRFAGKFKCRYTALIKRPQVQPDNTTKYVTVRPFKTRTGQPNNHRSRELQIIGPQPVPDPNFGFPQDPVGVIIGGVFNAPTDSPTTSPTKGPTTSPTISPTISPTLSPTLNPTLSPTLFPTLYPTLYPTLNPTLEPTEEPTAPPPTELPTLSPVGLPVVPDVSAVVSVNGTTLIFVLDGAHPGVPLPNSLKVTDIVVQGIPATKRRKALDALDMITDDTTTEGDGATIEDKNIILEEGVEVVTDIEAEVELDINGTVGADLDINVTVGAELDINVTAELELDINGTQSREPDGSFCAVGPDGRSVQYVSGGTYVGPYRCTFETEDERGFIVLADLNLDVVLFVDPPDIEPLPPKPKPPTPKPVVQPSWGGGYPQTSMPTHKPVKPWQPAWKPHWSAPEKPDYHEPHGPIFWGWGKSGKTKGTKTLKAGKSKSYKTFKEWSGSKSSKSKSSKSKSSKAKSSKGMFTWWRGGIDGGSGIVFNKDGTAEGAAIKEEPLLASTNTEEASGLRSRGIRSTLVAAIVCSLHLLID